MRQNFQHHVPFVNWGETDICKNDRWKEITALSAIVKKIKAEVGEIESDLKENCRGETTKCKASPAIRQTDSRPHE